MHLTKQMLDVACDVQYLHLPHASQAMRGVLQRPQVVGRKPRAPDVRPRPVGGICCCCFRSSGTAWPAAAAAPAEGRVPSAERGGRGRGALAAGQAGRLAAPAPLQAGRDPARLLGPGLHGFARFKEQVNSRITSLVLLRLMLAAGRWPQRAPRAVKVL